jgi:hypothetical protein
MADAEPPPIVQAARFNDTITLIDRYGTEGFTPEDARANDSLALRVAAARGCSQALVVLHNLYGLNTQDAQKANNSALHFAATNGHSEVLLILRVVYRLTTADASRATLKCCGSFMTFTD